MVTSFPNVSKCNRANSFEFRIDGFYTMQDSGSAALDSPTSLFNILPKNQIVINKLEGVSRSVGDLFPVSWDVITDVWVGFAVERPEFTHLVNLQQ